MRRREESVCMQDNTQVNNNKLYVGNLPYSITQEELQQLFGQYGEVTNVTLIIDKMSGRSKGFGFVEFAAADQAAAAAEAVNGQDLSGRALIVNVARPQEPRDDRRGGGGFRPRQSFGGGGGGRGGNGGGRGGSGGGYNRDRSSSY